MALLRQWSYPANATITESSGSATAAIVGPGPGFVLGADALSSPTFVSAPPNSASVANGYGANTASVATVVQNTLGYDSHLTAYFYGAASVATFVTGVGAATPVAMQTVNTTAITATNLWTFSAYVPAGYYWSFQATQANGVAVPSSSLVTVWSPV